MNNINAWFLLFEAVCFYLHKLYNTIHILTLKTKHWCEVQDDLYLYEAHES